MYASQLFRNTQACHRREIDVPSWVRVSVASIKNSFLPPHYPTRENACTWMQGFSGAETFCSRENVIFIGVQSSADGDNGNRATAAEMSLPTLLKFKRRQRVIKHMLCLILDRVIREAQRAGRLGPRIDTSYDITFPAIDSGEHQTLAHSAYYLVQALTSAKAQGWISDETAMQMLFKFAGEEINVHEELVRVGTQTGTQNRQVGIQDEKSSDKQ